MVAAFSKQQSSTSKGIVQEKLLLSYKLNKLGIKAFSYVSCPHAIIATGGQCNQKNSLMF